MIRRRDALKGFAGLAGLATLTTLPGCNRTEDVPPSSDPVFQHGVASGDPLPNAVILWTRVSSATTSSSDLSVTWEVSKDAAFSQIVTSGSFTTNADRDYTVKVDATNLEPSTSYFYRFTALGYTSPVGRTRTAPANGDNAKPLRFAVVSCASLPHGYFHVYRAISERPDIDAVLHLGDYIYEYAEGDYGTIRASEPQHAVQTLADYRQRYAQYRRDPLLQEAHRQHAFICIWDDHEFIDNSWTGGTTGDNSAVGPWDERKAAARRAYSEWIPIRDLVPDGSKVWRSFQYGALAELIFLDTRMWGREQQAPKDDPRLADPNRQLLGADQEAWLSERLRTSTAKWKLVCQQVMMAEAPAEFRVDGWDDYPAARSRFFDILEKTPVEDVVVLSGDVHSSFASELSRTPADPAVYDPLTAKGSLAVEFITPAVSSPGSENQSAESFTTSPWIKYADLINRGFILLDVTEERAHASWFHIGENGIEGDVRSAVSFSLGYSTYSGENRLRFEKDPPPTLVDAPVLAPVSAKKLP